MVDKSTNRRSPVESGRGIGGIIRRVLGPQIIQVSARDAHARHASAVVLDVREPGEFRSGHIPGAIHIPLGELGRRLRDLDRETAVITVCRTGHRSGAAAKLLAREGYKVENLRGGMIAWMREQLPVRTGKGRS